MLSISYRYLPHCRIRLTRGARVSSVRATTEREFTLEDDPHTARLKTLEDRIAAAKKANAPPERADENYSMANTAWRMVIELVAGLGIGFGIGYGLDVLFGTIPIFMLVFMGLGLAAGVKTMMRTAKELQDKAISAAGTDPDAEDKGN